MYNISNIGQTTGLKAVIWAIIIMAGIGFKVWNGYPHYRNASSEQLDVAAGQSVNYHFTIEKDSQIKFDISKVDDANYYLALLEEPDFNKLKAMVDTGQGNVDEINFLLKQDCKGDQTFADQHLAAGTYYLWLEAKENKPFHCQLDVAIYK
ncbi:MAG: hypothetical protein ACF8OB_06115 [Phycisphaeraceae bacterium JB051]